MIRCSVLFKLVLLITVQFRVVHLAAQEWDVERGGSGHESVRPDFRDNPLDEAWWDVARRNIEPVSSVDGLPGSVCGIRFHPNGNWLLSAGEDAGIRVWNHATGQLVHSILHLFAEVTAMTISHAGDRVYATDVNRYVFCCEVASGGLIYITPRYPGRILSLDLSPNDSILVSSGNSTVIRLWDTSSGQLLDSLIGHRGYVDAVRFFPDGIHLASCSMDSTIMIWNRLTGSACDTLYGHTGGIYDLDISSDGTRLASGSADGTVRIWDAVSGTGLHTLNIPSSYFCRVNFSPAGNRLATVGKDDSIRIWNVDNGTLLKTFKAGGADINNLDFSPDGTRLASCSYDSNIKMWDMASYQETGSWYGSSRDIKSLDLSSTGQLGVAGWNGRDVRLWSDPDLTQCDSLPSSYNSECGSLAFSPDGSRLAIGYQKKISIYNPVSRELLNRFDAHTKVINALDFSPDGHWLVSGSSDSTVKLWDVATYTLLLTLDGHQSQVRSVTFSKDGKTVVAGGEDGRVLVWSALTGELQHSLCEHDADVTCVSYSPDGTHLAAGYYDGVIHLWNSDHYSPVSVMFGAYEMKDMDFSPCGFYLSIVSYKKIETFDVRLGTRIMTIIYDHGTPRGLVYNQDGSRLIAGGWGYHNLKVYDVSRLPPSVAETDATDIQSTQAVLHGLAVANNLTSSLTFEYGRTTDYGSMIQASPASISGMDPVQVSAVISGLTPNKTYHYRLIGENEGGINSSQDRTFTTLPGTGIEDPESARSKPELTLLGNYPNPFNHSTRITYELGKAAPVTIDLYNTAGQWMMELTAETGMEPGIHQIIWNGCDPAGHPLSSGIYFYRIRTAHQSMVGKLLLLR
ncbi:MAG: T9SS type A sorting domain-containing protein [Candidatus Delongbacteria bacterium]|nr:T9SS type A sorting domain-containing protein [Candidatus Delongbacteria bacterium]